METIKKVIYISYQPLTEKNWEDYYLANLIEHGLSFEYWDLSAIFFPGIQKNTFNSENSIIFNSLNEIEHRLVNQKNSSVFFVIMITYEARVVKLFQLLTKYKCYTSFFARGMFPMPPPSIKSIFFKICKAFNPKLLINYFFNKRSIWLKKKSFVMHYNTVFTAGDLGICTVGAGYGVEKNKSNIINLNSFDFEKFITTQNAENIIKGKYCVFLDEYLPYHPDFFMLKIRTIDPTNYYKSLNTFFGAIERQFNLKVVIAAHPKAEKYISENPFDGRKIFFNKSAELTKFSEFTLVHYSTSVSFPVLFKKPVLFLSTNSIKTVMADQYRFISFFAETIGSKHINIDEFSGLNITINSIDNNKYDDYKYKYLTSKESEQKKSVEIFCDYISNL